MLNTTHTLRTPAAAVLAALALASFGLAACGESSGGSSQTSAAAKRALEQIAKAKSIPSTTTSTPQSGTASIPSATNAPQSGKSSGVPSGSAQPRRAAGVSRFKQVLEKFTDCLRQNGVPVSKNSSKGLLGLQALDRSSPKFKGAALKCRGLLASALRGAG